jgi:hypothetical protein
VGQHRFDWGRTGRRGGSRAVFLLLGIALLSLAGCGASGEGAKTDPEKGADAELLNAALDRERALLRAYTAAMPVLRGQRQDVARRFRAHEQEYMDAITKALRGLGGEVEPGADAEPGPGPAEADPLGELYRQEGEALTASLDAAPLLHTAAPRTLAASLAAGHAAHRVVLRRLARLPAAELAPKAFDSGEEPLPAAGR